MSTYLLMIIFNGFGQSLHGSTVGKGGSKHGPCTGVQCHCPQCHGKHLVSSRKVRDFRLGVISRRRLQTDSVPLIHRLIVDDCMTSVEEILGIRSVAVGRIEIVSGRPLQLERYSSWRYKFQCLETNKSLAGYQNNMLSASTLKVSSLQMRRAKSHRRIKWHSMKQASCVDICCFETSHYVLVLQLGTM